MSDVVIVGLLSLVGTIIGTLGKDLETLERLCAVVRECQGCVGGRT